MTDTHLYVTSHAKKRFRERMKLPVRAMRRIVQDALKLGKPPEEMPHYARVTLEAQQQRFAHAEAAFVRIYRNFVFVFFDTNPEITSLLTLYPLEMPAEFLN